MNTNVTGFTWIAFMVNYMFYLLSLPYHLLMSITKVMLLNPGNGVVCSKTM